VQYAQGSRLCSVMCIPKGSERVPNGIKEQVVIQAVVVQTKRIQHVWNGKDKVVMPYRQGGLQQFLYPEGLLCGLTLGTMPVPAAVVAVTNHTTLVTDFLVPSQGCCPAKGYFAQHFGLQRC